MLILLRKDKYPINNFTIYGERHSGTNLLERIGKEALSLTINWEFGWKHFFGFVDYQKIVRANNTLFFGITRNPYDWLMAMYTQQYHIPKKNEKPITKFLLNNWFSIDDNRKEIKEDRHYLIGRKYKNIFEMRKNKLQYMINYMPEICTNLCLTTYENLTDNPLTTLKTISKYFGCKNNEDDIPLIWNRKNYDMSKEVKAIIDSNIDWDIESYFGYSPKK